MHRGAAAKLDVRDAEQQGAKRLHATARLQPGAIKKRLATRPPFKRQGVTDAGLQKSFERFERHQKAAVLRFTKSGVS